MNDNSNFTVATRYAGMNIHQSVQIEPYIKFAWTHSYAHRVQQSFSENGINKKYNELMSKIVRWCIPIQKILHVSFAHTNTQTSPKRVIDGNIVRLRALAPLMTTASSPMMIYIR